MFSYWEQQSFTTYNHIIIGSGIVGLSLAIELKERFPADRVLILERGLLPTGASTRNAGFACMGSASELLDDLTSNSEQSVVSLFAARQKGLTTLRNRIGDNLLEYSANGGFELLNAENQAVLNQLDYLNNLLLPITHKPAFIDAGERIANFGFGGTYSAALIENTCEAGINTGKMMRALTDMAIMLGIEIKTGADVTKYEEQSKYVEVSVQDPFRKATMQLKSNTLSICTNAFTSTILPNEDIVPGRGQVLITEPIEGLQLKGVFHFDKGYYYFREIDGRVLFGGGRNVDFDTEQTTEIALNKQIQADLDEKLKTIILPNTPYRIAQRWAGIMAFGKNKQPIIKAISDRTFGAFRMGGMGVALGSDAAAKLADIIQERLT